MTRLELHIDRVVLHGVPPEYAEQLGPLLERRLGDLLGGHLAGDEPVREAAAGRAVPDAPALADTVARQVWSAAARSLPARGGER